MRIRGSLIAAAAALVAVTAASAQQGAPSPGCTGTAADDVRGDQRTGFAPAPASADLVSAFFRTDRTTTGRLITTANVRAANLDPAVPPGVRSISWIMHWRDGDLVRYADATAHAGGQVSFATGRVESGFYVADAPTSGVLFPGENGVAQIVLPEALSKPGQRLRAPYASSRVVSEVAGTGLSEEADLAPDDAQSGGRTYAVAECTGPAQPPVPEPGPPVPAPESKPLEYAPPTVTLMTTEARARWVSRKRRILLSLRSTGPLTKVTGTLRSKRLGKVGAGRLKAMHGKGTIRLRLSRRVPRGFYELRVKAIDAEGAPVRAKGRLRLR